jgi:hypothetical protein
MMRKWIAPITTAALLFAVLYPSLQAELFAEPADSTTEVSIDPDPLLLNAERIGLNLGHWTSWGAEQLSRNILKNPGFEGIIDRSLVRVMHPHADRFSDDQTWLARDDGFWAGAEFVVMTGTAAGQRGQLRNSLARGVHGLPEYHLTSPIAALAPGDIVALTLVHDGLPPTHWWFSGPETGAIGTSNRQAPGSPGTRSILLTPAPGRTVTLYSHLDTLHARAGKLLPVMGDWHFKVWVHAETTATLQISFRRAGSPPFMNSHHVLAPGWQLLEQDFAALDLGPDGPLELALAVTGGVVALDDVWLGPDTAGRNKGEDLASAAFSPQTIALLQRLQPGYLRDWQGQLGDTLANRLAPAEARRASRYRPGNADFSYGLEEFLDLCRVIQAQPWLIVPTTFSLEEAAELGSWLHARIPRHGFTEVLVEFGNENWNSIFRPAGIQDPARLGEAADRLFAALLAGAKGDSRIRTVLGAQHANPQAALQMGQASQQADVLALAPYLLPRLDTGDQSRAMELLFAPDGGRFRDILAGRPPHQELAVYEVNLHTTRGNLGARERDAVVTSNAAGSALAQSLLQTLLSGVRRQNVYTLAGFDTQLESSQELTQLFGITRDLSGTAGLRPTGWALEMLNRVLAPAVHAGRVPGAAAGQLTVAAFTDAHGWSAALVNAAAESRQVQLQFPHDGRTLPQAAEVLDGSAPIDLAAIDKPGEPVPMSLGQQGPRVLNLTIPAFSLVILTRAPLIGRP